MMIKRDFYHLGGKICLFFSILLIFSCNNEDVEYSDSKNEAVQPSPYNHFITSPVDQLYQLCPTGDMACQNDMSLTIQTVDFFKSLGPKNSLLGSYNTIFYTARKYLLEHEFSDEAQLFLSDKLSFLAEWNKTQDNSTPEKQIEKLEFIHSSLQYFIDNPATTNEQFKELFM
ncbi:hypothetical protein [Chryseobacterium culicis]|uniref:Uncharacterized protein n=1 Tax=Chryseobacterium culicis TaxID=680127 RepID=A0A1H6HQU3_CHRCI|nr:hypothetical protein [Chryseobacterium culicis]SEH36544.1 hypothetical protein SAMN05421593_3253 [Chryseobacterium culicis]